MVYVTLLLLISCKLTVVVTVLLVLLAIVVRLVTRKVVSLGERMTRVNAEVASKMVDGVGGVEIIRGHGQEDHERERFAGVSARLARVSKRTGILSGAVYPLYEVLAAARLVVVLLTSVTDSASLAPMLVFLFVLYRLAPVVKRIEQERVELKAAEGAVNETFSIIQREEEHYLSSGAIPFEGLRDAITLDGVGYNYDADTSPALNNIKATIPATGLTAIVGPSGAGKSTLIRLLLRFFDPTEGRILVDGEDLRELDLRDWRSRISVVPQQAFLFNETVRENIAYGASRTDEEIIAAAKAAGAHEFVTNLSDGYDTRLGENGIELSGGEAQRVCLARAIVRRPDLLLLDEATNALDSESEALIQQALDRMKHDCSVVVVAHRSATIANADQVLELGRREATG